MLGVSSRRLKKLVRRVSGLGCIEDLSADQRRAMWPPARALSDKHIRNCRLVENRDVMLEHMPKDAVCAEVGIWKCDYSKQIMKVMQPALLHLIDIDPAAIECANEAFGLEIKRGTVSTHLGDSAELIASMPDRYFDWIYIDGDHSYDGVKRDLAAAQPKLKPNALLAMNDYIYFEPSGFSKYGVMEAVNEFCIEYEFEFLYFALHGRMYHDVVLRRIGAAATD